LLAFDQGHRRLAPRQASHHVITESPNGVIESGRHLSDVAKDEVRVLIAHEFFDEVRAHFDLGVGPSHAIRL
jgi:hypothetical protein